MNMTSLQKLSYGVYVICSKYNGRINGQIANAVFQITSEPPAIAISINKENCTHEFIKYSKSFSISILSEDTPMKFIGTFGFKCGWDIDKFENINFVKGKTGSPIIIDHSIAFIEGNLINSVDVGTHTIFIGAVVNGDILSNKSPMTYEYYHNIKGGLSPKTAPTYIKKQKKNETKRRM